MEADLHMSLQLIVRKGESIYVDKMTGEVQHTSLDGSMTFNRR